MEKSPDAFRTISEVAEFLDTPAHVLRFWESRFPQVRPIKRAGGRRYYRPTDVALLSGIRRLLHEDGLTIRGVQKILREQGVRHVAGLIDDEPAEEEDDITLEADVILDGIVSSVPEPAAVLPFPSQARMEQPKEPLAEAPPQAPPAPAAKADAPVKRSPPRVSPDQGKLFAEEEDRPVAASSAKPDAGAQNPTEEGAEQAETPAPAAAQPAAPGSPEPEPVAASAPETPTEPASALTPPITAESDQAKPAAESPKDAAPAPEKPAMAAEAPEENFWLASDLRAARPSRLARKRAEILPLALRLQALRDHVAELGRVPRR
jgi:resuscitation-promoting factor RpfA